MFRFLPEQASSHAPDVDWMNNLITDLSVFFTVAIVGAMIYFAIRYRKRNGRDHDTPRILGSHALEAVWTIVPTVVCIYIGYYGIVIYRGMREVPPGALTINATGQKWYWTFEYEYKENGKAVSKKVGGKNVEWVVPVNKPVKVVLQSRDVLHSLFIPAMRVKRDAVPGQFHYLTFTPIKTGEYPISCTEYCGTDHWDMMGTLRVVSEVEFDQWLRDRSSERALIGMAPSDIGGKLFKEKGCNSCHTLDGSRLTGPSFLKLYGRQEKMSDGSMVEVEENYLRESILSPAKQLVDGYANVMTSFDGQLSDEEISALIAFIKIQDGSAPAPVPVAVVATSDEDWAKLSPLERGEKLMKEKAVPACGTCHSLDGTKGVGPSFKGLFGREEELEGGQKVAVDEAYLTESILNPMAKIVKGYGPSMPPVYASALKEQEVKDMVEYLKTIK